MIDPTAIIAPDASIAEGVFIGAWSVIGSKVRIDSGSYISANCCILGNTSIGKNNVIHQYCVIGAQPSLEERSDAHESTRKLLVGDNNVIREGCVIESGHSDITRIGSDNYIMVYSCLGYDCLIGDSTTIANKSHFDKVASLSDYASVSSGVSVFANTKIGESAMLGGGSNVEKDVPAYTLVVGDIAKVRRLSDAVVQYSATDADLFNSLYRAFDLLYLNRNSMTNAIEEIRKQCGDSKEIDLFVESISGTRSPIRHAGIDHV